MNRVWLAKVNEKGHDFVMQGGIILKQRPRMYVSLPGRQQEWQSRVSRKQ